MNSLNYEATPWHSFKTGKLCDGCKLCVQGKKTVLFITGICPRKCYYCPISSEKYAHDVVFANEWKIKDVNDPVELFEEVRLTGAKGAGITGGDPLAKLDRTCEYIKKLKKEFGTKFHIHLYTSLNLTSQSSLKKLFLAGLDEIRFHPDLDDDSLWNRLSLAKNFDWDVGVEIPVIPKKIVETEKLINFINDKIDFLNLNELELSDTDTAHYNIEHNSRKNDHSYAVRGSEELALKLLDKCSKLKLRTHYCSAKLKNQVQVGERLKRRAKHVALAIDELTEEYLLYRGAIYLKDFEPSYNYKQGINIKQNKTALLKAKQNLINECLFEDEDLVLDTERNRLLTHFSLAKEHSLKIKELGLVPTIVEEYPSSDYFCVDLEFL